MASTQNNKFIQAKKVFPASATSTTHSPKDNQTGRDKKYRQRLKKYLQCQINAHGGDLEQ
jgi:hypothetical protein